MTLGLQLEALWSRPKTLAAAAVVLAVVVQAWYDKRKRALQGSAPMVSYLIPWVGSALEVAADPDAFFDRARRKHGDVFAMKSLGRVITYVVSPSLISEVYRNAQKCEFEDIRLSVTIKHFDIPASLIKSDISSELLRPTLNKYLSSTGVVSTVELCAAVVWEQLEKEGSKFEGVSTPLLDFALPVIYQASVISFYGRSSPAAESYKPFRDFYGSFHLALAGIPRILLRKHLEALATLQKLFGEYFDRPHDDASEMVLENERVLRNHDYDSKSIGAYYISFLFALTANTPNAGYWLIALNLQREEGLRPLTDEIDEAVASWKQRNPDQNIRDHLYEFISTAELPLLTSAIQETLRYSNSVTPFRRVIEPMELGGYHLHKGDEIVCVTRSVHFDEEIHENPWEYDPRRYMKEKKFTKNGKIISNHSMVWGGGVSMCKGRHFATKELKAFMAFLLIQYTLEVDPNSAERPTFMSERVGSGVLDPRGDIRIILRARK